MTQRSISIAQPDHAFIRRPWCLWLAVAIVLLGGLSNTVYLWNHCPLALSEDESHYWEWSRHLDYGYYSKPPGIAWLLWLAMRMGATLGLNGDGSGAALMPVLRMPAVLFAILSGLLSLFLARRIFRDDRAALAVTLLSAAVPMFAVGSLLITIDSPMYLCWAASVYCLWRSVEARSANSGASTFWLYIAGAACGCGMLFKPVLIAIPISAAIAAIADVHIRRALKSWHSLGALLLVLLSQVPTIIWNSQHGWVTFKHIATQGGFVGTAEKKSWLVASIGRLSQFVGGQAGGMGGLPFILLAVAAFIAWKRVGRSTRSETLMEIPDRTRWTFLLSFTLPLWIFYLLMNFWKGTEINWPAASYFTGMILTAGVFVQGWNATDAPLRQRWRVWGTLTITLGILMSAIAMNFHRLYPLAARHLQPLDGTPAYADSIYFPGKWDPAAKKLRGFEERAAALEKIIQEMRQQSGQDPLIATTRYDASSSLAFYLPDHPLVYCLMSNIGERHSQYDLWPGLNQRNSAGSLLFAGSDMITVTIGADDAKAKPLLEAAFTRVDLPERIPIFYMGIRLRELTVIRAYGFKGLPESSSLKY